MDSQAHVASKFLECKRIGKECGLEVYIEKAEFCVKREHIANDIFITFNVTQLHDYVSGYAQAYKDVTKQSRDDSNESE